MPHISPSSPLHTAAAYGLVVLAPVLAWLLWVATSGGATSDARHIAWFVTVALGCVLAGGLAPRRTGHLLALAAVAVVATITTLFRWWSSEDSSGLFLVGIIIATPLVAGASVPLLLIGRGLGRATRSAYRGNRAHREA